MADPPNVLLLVTDQHRPDVLGYAGDPIVRTPTLDWLAETGTVFTNAYTPAPVCVPARHSMRTGQLPRTWDRFGFDAFESPMYRTLPLQLARHGYMSACGGKMHYPGWNQHQGWRKRIGPTPMKQHGIGDGHIPEPAPGADTGSLSRWKWTIGEELGRAGIAESRTQIQDRRVVEGVEQFLREYFSSPVYDRAQPETPLLLQTSLIEPHYPYFAADRDRFTYYLNRVEPFIEAAPDVHPFIDDARTAGECRIVRPGTDANPRSIRRATAAYYAMIETVDALFGRVIDAMRHHGEDPDEWLIAFTADHGELLGERGMWGKGQFLESSARVPLVVRYPEAFDPSVVDQNVNLCDLYATICDVADVPVPSNRDSRSMVPLLAGETSSWRNETISQGVGNQSLVRGIDSAELMIKRDQLKYCYFGETHGEVLFDLARDPGESQNVIDESRYREDVTAFRRRRGELGYGPNADATYRDAGYDAGTRVEDTS